MQFVFTDQNPNRIRTSAMQNDWIKSRS